MPKKAPEWLNAEIEEVYPACQGNIRAIQRAIQEKRGVEIAYMTISNRLERLGLPRPRAKGNAPLMATPTHTSPHVSATELADPAKDSALSAIADMLPVIEGTTNALLPHEMDALERCERIIAEGIQTFVEVGRALLVIKDQQLYRQTHTTFEAYCRERWDLSRTYAYQLIGASEVVDEVAAVSDVVPANEAQARPLANLPPEQRVEVWQEVVETAPTSGITAKHVQAIVKLAKTTGTTPPHTTTPKRFDVQATQTKIKALYMEWLKHCATDDALDTAQFFLHTLSDLAQGRARRLHQGR